MDEIVWAVDPQHDTFSGLMDYISAFAEDFLRTAGIRCRMDMPLALPAMRVDAELRYNLFLALKEALNNVVKHAQATEVWLRLRVEPDAFHLDGRGQRPGPAAAGQWRAGADADRIASGPGLVNLRNAWPPSAAVAKLHSTPGQGTRVEMTVAVTAHRHRQLWRQTATLG